MADSMDLVQQRVEENLQRHIQNARARKPGIGADKRSGYQAE